MKYVIEKIGLLNRCLQSTHVEPFEFMLFEFESAEIFNVVVCFFNLGPLPTGYVFYCRDRRGKNPPAIGSGLGWNIL